MCQEKDRSTNLKSTMEWDQSRNEKNHNDRQRANMQRDEFICLVREYRFDVLLVIREQFSGKPSAISPRHSIGNSHLRLVQ